MFLTLKVGRDKAQITGRFFIDYGHLRHAVRTGTCFVSKLMFYGMNRKIRHIGLALALLLFSLVRFRRYFHKVRFLDGWISLDFCLIKAE